MDEQAFTSIQKEALSALESPSSYLKWQGIPPEVEQRFKHLVQNLLDIATTNQEGQETYAKGQTQGSTV